jgi:hypothetical protein
MCTDQNPFSIITHFCWGTSSTGPNTCCLLPHPWCLLPHAYSRTVRMGLGSSNPLTSAGFEVTIILNLILTVDFQMSSLDLVLQIDKQYFGLTVPLLQCSAAEGTVASLRNYSSSDDFIRSERIPIRILDSRPIGLQPSVPTKSCGS